MPQPGIGFAGVGKYFCMHACIANDFLKFSIMSYFGPTVEICISGQIEIPAVKIIM